MKHCLQTEMIEINELIDLFKSRFNGKSNATFRKNILKNYGLNYSDRTLRNYIQYIRKNDLCGVGFILSSVEKGYWYTEDFTEMSLFVTQEFNRMASQFETVEKLQIRLRTTKKQTNQTKQISIFN